MSLKPPKKSDNAAAKSEKIFVPTTTFVQMESMYFSIGHPSMLFVTVMIKSFVFIFQIMIVSLYN